MPSAPTIIDLEIAARFKLVREDLGLNQYEMAELCKISQPMVGYIENGKREMPIHILKTLFIRKNVSPLYVLAISSVMYHKSKEDKKTLLTVMSDFKADLVVLQGLVAKVQQDIKIVAQNK